MEIRDGKIELVESVISRKKAMRRMLILMIWLTWISLAGLSTEVGSLRGFLYGSEPACAYDNWVSHVAEGQVSTLNIYAPWDIQNNDFGEYHIPSSQELDRWALVMQAWLALDLTGAQAIIDSCGFPYEVVVFQDTDSSRLLYMLREDINLQVDDNDSDDPALHEFGSFDYAWGLYIFDPSASRPMIITAPHPCDDYPSPVISLEAMQAWDARFLFIAGAGREVAYTGTNYASNNQSVSDPSRMADHPFNVAYQHAATQLRGITGWMEFSVQLHSYDWNKYGSKPPVMLSAGNGRYYPNLPIKDHSRSQNDIIHNTPWEVIAANSFGTHNPVYVDQYYSVYRSNSYDIYYDADGIFEELPHNWDLPGALENQQMLFTEQYNNYDSYCPFLHIEMDELPRSLPQEYAQLCDFYGYTEEAGWPMENRYARFLSFYRPMIDAINLCLDDLLYLDDGNAPSNPENLAVITAGTSYYTLSWQRSYDYDFESYEVQVRYHNGVNWQLNEWDGNLDAELAWQLLNEYRLSWPTGSTLVYVRLRARDKHGNTSNWTPELKIFRPVSGMGSMTNFSLQPGNRRVKVSFNATIVGAVGYNVNRAIGDGPMLPYGTWQEYPQLAYNPSAYYEFWDNNANNGQVYRYQISAIYADGGEFWLYRILKAQPYKPLNLWITKLNSGQTDSLRIAINQFAQDGEDSLDQGKGGPGSQAVWIAAQKEGGNEYLGLDVKGHYDPQSAPKLWNLKTYTAFGDQAFSLSSDIAASQLDGDLLIKDNSTGLWHDLRAGSFSWTGSAYQYRTFELWWGYTQPRVEFPNLSLQRYPAGSLVNLSWQVVNPARVASTDLWMVGPEDSLLISAGLPPTQSSFMWDAPGLPGTGYRLTIKGTTETGALLRAQSPYLYDILPQNMVFGGPAGHSLICVPVSAWSAAVDELFSAGTTVWTLDESANWQSVSSLSGNVAYLVHSPQAWQLSLPMTEDQGLAYRDLTGGWNLVANPHYHRYHLSQLGFDLAGQSLSWDQLSSQDQIYPRIYSFTQTGWTLTDHIDPLQAVLFWRPGSQSLSMIFNPQSSDQPLLSWPPRWELTLSAWDGFRGRDAINIGVTDDATDGLDAGLDLIKAPPFPDQELQLALFTSDSGPLQSDFKGLYPDFDLVQKNWQFTLQRADAGPVGFTYSASDLPAGYEVEVNLGGQTRILQPGQLSWIDLDAGSLTGSLIVRSYQTALPALATRSEIAVWPNPFRSQVSIRMERVKGDPVKAAVYNLRGQRIAILKDQGRDQNSLSFTWDGKDASGHRAGSGVYFIRVSQGNRSHTQRVLKLD